MSTKTFLITSQSIKNMKQTIILFNLLLFTLVSFAQDKKVHFAHGLGGDYGSWASLASKMDACPNVTTTNFEMTSTEGMEKYIGEFSSNLSSEDQTAIAIGHSFGGACLRSMDNANTKQFGGYFTVGTPHDGAPLANAYLDGELQNWISIGSVRNNKFQDALSKIQNIFSFNNSIPENLQACLGGGLINTIAKASPFVGDGTSAEELKVGGEIQNGLGAAILPAIGIECAIPIEKNEFWTTIDHIADNKLFGSAYNVQTYEFAFEIEKALLVTTETLNILVGVTYLFPEFQSKVRSAAKKTRSLHTWWASIEHNWNELIGAGGKITGYNYVHEEIWVCDCIDSHGNPVRCDGNQGQEIYDVDQYAIICDNNSDCYETETTKIAIFGDDEPNDGIIPLERQELPGALVQEYVEGPTHFGEPNSGGVEATIRKFTKIIPPHPVFKITNCL